MTQVHEITIKVKPKRRLFRRLPDLHIVMEHHNYRPEIIQQNFKPWAGLHSHKNYDIDVEVRTTP